MKITSGKKLLVSVNDRHSRNSQLRRQQAGRRQLHAGSEFPAQNGAADRIVNLPVERTVGFLSSSVMNGIFDIFSIINWSMYFVYNWLLCKYHLSINSHLCHPAEGNFYKREA